MTDDEKKRRGAKSLYTVEVLYRVGAEIKRALIKNYLASEFMILRETLVVAGFHHRDPDDARHGWIIMPRDVISVEYFVQDKFFE